MSEAGELVDPILQWDGVDESAPERWMASYGDAILIEASTGGDGPIGEVFDRINTMASSNAPAASWGLAQFFGTVQNAASAAVHKTFGFVSAGVDESRVGRSQTPVTCGMPSALSSTVTPGSCWRSPASFALPDSLWD